MSTTGLALPPGATLVSNPNGFSAGISNKPDDQMKLPPGAKLVGAAPPAKPSQPAPSNNTGILPGLWRAAKGVFDMPGDVVIAGTTGPQTPGEQKFADALPQNPVGQGVAQAGLAAKRLIVDPLQAEAETSRRMSAIAQQQNNPDAQHLANMHTIASGVPVVGPMAASLVQRYLLGDKSGAMAEMAGYVAAPKLTEKLLNAEPPKNPLAGSPQQKLSRVIGAQKGGDATFRDDIKVAGPELDKAAQARPVRTIQDTQAVVNDALANTNNEFNLALQPIANVRTVPVDVAYAIKSKITSAMLKTAEGRQTANILKNRALEFENQKWSYSELNQERMDSYARLRPFNNAVGEAQTAMTRTRANVMADRAINEATRELVYNAMDSYHNNPARLAPGATPKDFNSLKRQQAALLSIKGRLDAEVPSVENQTDALKGSGFLERGHVSSYGHPETGKIGTSIHNLQNLFSTPEARANAAAQAAFPQSNRLVTPVRPPQVAVSLDSYPTAQAVMLGMKTGDLSQDDGNRLLQKLRGKGSVVRPMAPPR